MTYIIKHTEIVGAMQPTNEKDFQVGCYIVDNHAENLFIITKKELHEYRNGEKVDWFSYEGINPITLEKDGLSREEIVQKALQTVKDRLKWKRPISSKERETYTLVRRTLFSENYRNKYFKPVNR